MRVGLGLPTTAPGANRELLLSWAREAEQGPFSTLGVFDRLVYDSWDPLIALATAASVTSRIRLATTVLNGPLYNTVLLAKALASLDVLSGGRLVVGLGIGARDGDYIEAGIQPKDRGNRLSEQLIALRDCWEEKQIGPTPIQPGGPKLLVGGQSDAVFARMARSAHGYIHGGGPPRSFARAAEKARAAWVDAGRPDHLHLWGMAYYALGEEAAQAGYRYLRDYYSFTGPFAEKIASGLLRTPEQIRDFLNGYKQAGCEELILFPTAADLAQVGALADLAHAMGSSGVTSSGIPEAAL